MRTITAVELACRVRTHGLRISPSDAAMFLGYWLENAVVEEHPVPGRYRLTPYGHQLAAWLQPHDTEREAA